MSKRAIYMGGKRTVVAVAEESGGTFGPLVATNDWKVSEYTAGGMGGPDFVADPSTAGIGDEAAGMKGNLTYAMMWELDDIASSATIVSATLKVTTTDSGGNENAVWYIGTEAGIDTSEPADASAADTAVNRSGGTWSAAGITPSAHDTQYSIDFKDEIEAIIARGSWAEGGTITLFISGDTLSSMEQATVETIAASASADKPSLTVVYS